MVAAFRTTVFFNTHRRMDATNVSKYCQPWALINSRVQWRLKVSGSETNKNFYRIVTFLIGQMCIKSVLGDGHNSHWVQEYMFILTWWWLNDARSPIRPCSSELGKWSRRASLKWTIDMWRSSDPASASSSSLLILPFVKFLALNREKRSSLLKTEISSVLRVEAVEFRVGRGSVEHQVCARP